MKKLIFICFTILLFALMTAVSWAGVSLEIQNVDIDAGTLDIYMSSEAGCSYCTDYLYDNQNNCELFGNDGSGASWNFDSNMDENP